MEKRNSCDVPLIKAKVVACGEPLVEAEVPLRTPKSEVLLPGVTAAKQQQMKDYAAKLAKKFPHMKPDRIMRKTAEYFKVELI